MRSTASSAPPWACVWIWNSRKQYCAPASLQQPGWLANARSSRYPCKPFIPLLTPMSLRHRAAASVVAVFALSAFVPRSAAAFQNTDSTAALLVDLIRVNTSNPPGNERRLAELLEPRFKALGFEVQIVQTPD